MPYTFSNDELGQIEELRRQAEDRQRPFADVYAFVAGLLSDNDDADVVPVRRWLEGAVQVNLDQGLFADGEFQKNKGETTEREAKTVAQQRRAPWLHEESNKRNETDKNDQ